MPHLPDLLAAASEALLQLSRQRFWHPALFATALYGLRYLGVAALFFWLARPHRVEPAGFDLRLHLRRELAYSALTVLVFGGVNAVIFGFGWDAYMRIYFHFRDLPAWWFWLSIPAMLVLHDTFFYWMHRAMHLPWLFGRVHRVHHQSIYPTAFAAYSFHPWEAVGEALIVTAIIYMIPVHPLALLLFQTLSTLYNAYGHSGREFYPEGVADHGLGRWLNTATLHAHHHRRGQHNYGLYFPSWDRWMKTLHQPDAPHARSQAGLKLALTPKQP